MQKWVKLVQKQGNIQAKKTEYSDCLIHVNTKYNGMKLVPAKIWEQKKVL